MSIVVDQRGKFCWRYHIPRRLRARVGKSRIFKSLKTREPNEVFRLTKMFDFAGTHLVVTLDRSDIPLAERAAVLNRFDAWCDEAINGWQPKRELGEPETPRRKQAATIAEHVIEVIRENADDPKRFSQALSAFFSGALEAIAESSQRPVLTVLDPSASSRPIHFPANSVQAAESAGLGLKDAIEKYLQEIALSRSPMTVAYHRSHLRMFLNVLGDRLLASITRLDVRHYKELLYRLPSRMNAFFPGKTYKEVLEIEHSRPMISVQTINHYVKSVCGLFYWAVDNGYVDFNPASRMTVYLPGPKFGARDPYSKNDLKTIFEKGPVHSGCRSQYQLRQPGRMIYRDHHFWIPLIGLFAGLRLNEIVTLRPDEIVFKGGVWCFEITETDIRKLKTHWSERLVPVHRELVRIGLFDYSDKLRRSGSDTLWPKLKSYKRGQGAESVSHFWTKYRRTMGITSPKKPFYSFRHSFIAGLKSAIVPAEVISELAGHYIGGELHRRYAKRSQPSLLYPAIKKLDFGLDLSHLHDS